MSIVWATREPGPARVEYRTGTGLFSSVAASSVFFSSASTGLPNYYQHEALLTGLHASTLYEYDLRVGGIDATPSAVDNFRTAPAPGTGTIRLVAFGDSGTGSSAQGQIADLLRTETFDIALHTGDLASTDGTYAQFETHFFPYYRDWLRRAAIFPSIGTDDDRTGSATPYRKFFTLPRDGATATFPNNAERFYSVDYGPVHLIALDTEAAFLSTSRRQEQLAWLTEDLQNSQHQPWRVAFFHRPPYSSGAQYGSDLAIRQAFGSLFEQYNVQVVLSGHAHSFERSIPWRASTNIDQQAVTYIVTGGGGAPLSPVGVNQWTAFSRSIHHYLRAVVSPTDFAIEAVGADGAVFDRFSLNRSAQDLDVAPPEVSIDSPLLGQVLSGVASVMVTATDDSRVEKVDLWIDGQLSAIDLTSPYTFSVDTRTLANGAHTLEAVAYDSDGKRAGTTRSVTVSNGSAAGDIVLYASEAAVRIGTWRVVNDATAATGRRLEHPEAGAPTIDPPLASPLHYVEFTVSVVPSTNYRLWLRMKGAGNSGYSDSVWVQASDTVDAAGAPIFRIGTASATRVNLQDCNGCSISGWGWQDNGFGAGVLGPALRFANGGVQTIRIQAREDGVSIDQIVLSPGTYLNSAPGALRNDATILPRTTANVLAVGEVRVDPPTLHTLGVQALIAGDANRNASVTIRYREVGTAAWREGLPLLRVFPETITVPVPEQFAGSIFDLDPATVYEIELHATDPDGGVDIRRLVTDATRPVPPVDPATPRLIQVQNAAGLRTALAGAQPGDVILLASGTYAGPFALSASGTEARPIVLRGASATGVILDGGNCPNCNVLEVSGSYVHVERLTIRNALRGLRFTGANATRNVARRLNIQNVVHGTGSSTGQSDFYICDNTIDGRLQWPWVFGANPSSHWDDRGVEVTGDGHVVCHNSIRGFGDPVVNKKRQARSWDVYGNDIADSWDGVELDEGEGNVRMFHNRFTNVMAPISIQPIFGGPAYVLRNVAFNVPDEQIKLKSLGGIEEPSGALIYHNTFVSPERALNLLSSITQHNFVIANNLFVGPDALVDSRAVDWRATLNQGFFDYNGYFPDGAFMLGTVSGMQRLFANFAQMQTSGIVESNGALLGEPIFAAGFVGPANEQLRYSPPNFALAPTSNAVNRAGRLSGVNDGYIGSAPDLGALELGCPVPSYGPRAEGSEGTTWLINCR